MTSLKETEWLLYLYIYTSVCACYKNITYQILMKSHCAICTFVHAPLIHVETNKCIGQTITIKNTDTTVHPKTVRSKTTQKITHKLSLLSKVNHEISNMTMPNAEAYQHTTQNLQSTSRCIKLTHLSKPVFKGRASHSNMAS